MSVAAVTTNLADELGPHGINVTVVHPGRTRTERLVARLAEQSAATGVPVADLEREIAGNSVQRLIAADGGAPGAVHC